MDMDIDIVKVIGIVHVRFMEDKALIGKRHDYRRKNQTNVWKELH